MSSPWLATAHECSSTTVQGTWNVMPKLMGCTRKVAWLCADDSIPLDTTTTRNMYPNAEAVRSWLEKQYNRTS